MRLATCAAALLFSCGGCFHWAEQAFVTYTYNDERIAKRSLSLYYYKRQLEDELKIPKSMGNNLKYHSLLRLRSALIEAISYESAGKEYFVENQANILRYELLYYDACRYVPNLCISPNHTDGKKTLPFPSQIDRISSSNYVPLNEISYKAKAKQLSEQVKETCIQLYKEGKAAYKQKKYVDAYIAFHKAKSYIDSFYVKNHHQRKVKAKLRYVLGKTTLKMNPTPNSLALQEAQELFTEALSYHNKPAYRQAQYATKQALATLRPPSSHRYAVTTFSSPYKSQNTPSTKYLYKKKNN